MSITRTNLTVDAAICDTCHDGQTTIATRFRDTLDQLEERGWRLQVINGTWVATCPGCVRRWA